MRLRTSSYPYRARLFSRPLRERQILERTPPSAVRRRVYNLIPYRHLLCSKNLYHDYRVDRRTVIITQGMVVLLFKSSSRCRNHQQQLRRRRALKSNSSTGIDEGDVIKLLQSLGLEKYTITFQAEEVDMDVLEHMNDDDLKTLGIPMDEGDVIKLLQSLGLEKYTITFQAEEVDMDVLEHMNDDDLKTLGIPMGPRKKILLAFESKLKS
ncbi:hypothetical protein ZOSMA_113G00600 [Zostera marina]|uniref:SAM domain-containing protein n=1 Tax=Zostera marina TaxID=29655 RepID=A0A0K9Q2P4_ZOSMR|nr:hypothetical protein ZOSMA_113G00600 [Zostera marina]